MRGKKAKQERREGKRKQPRKGLSQTTIATLRALKPQEVPDDKEG